MLETSERKVCCTIRSVTRKIPAAVIAVVSNALANRYTHAQIDQFMEAAGIRLEPSPSGNRQVKTRAWLAHANNTMPDTLAVLGKVIVELMDISGTQYDWSDTENPDKEKINNILGEYGLDYVTGGYITAVGATIVGKTLKETIDSRDLSGLQTEFERIYKNVDSDPASAVTAACALLESLFKAYIEENGLEMPTEQSIRPLWKVIRKDLNLDPAVVQDEDLKVILSGLAAIVDGTGSLRTHKGSAHGRGKMVYKLKPRHARLAAHAAFTLAEFVLEAWAERKA